MRLLTALVAAGLLFAAATGCNKSKTDSNNPGNAPVDAAQPIAYPPAQ